jgi:hypothetical protein
VYALSITKNKNMYALNYTECYIPTKLYRWNSKNMSTLHLIKHDVNFIRRNLTNILRIYVKVLNMKIIHKI